MPSAYEGIQEANKIFMERVAQGDAAALSTCYTEKCQFLVDNIETAEGRRAVQGVLQSFFDAGVKTVELITLEVEDLGDTAIEVGRGILRASKGELIDETKYIVICKREAEGCKLHRDIMNSNLPA